MAEPFVVDLADVSYVDRERVGGKAAGLGELLRAGLPVPAGFCVTTAAYRQFAAQRELADVFAVIQLAEADPSHLHDALERLRCALVATPVPAEVEDAISGFTSSQARHPRSVWDSQSWRISGESCARRAGGYIRPRPSLPPAVCALDR